MSNYLNVMKAIPVYVVGLVIICVLAVLYEYQVSIDSEHGFRFEPVNIQPIKTP